MFCSHIVLHRVLCGIWASTFLAALVMHAHSAPPEPDVQQQALLLMADLVPAGPAPEPPAKVSFQDVHGIWGKLFGDDQWAALVAVAPSAENEDYQPEDRASLCLLLWIEGGWKVQQMVGRVSANEDGEKNRDWAVKVRSGTNTRYVVSRHRSDATYPHASWRCDARTHRLVPTGWPQDAVPSIAGDFITFEKPVGRVRSNGLDTYLLVDGQIGAHVAAWRNASGVTSSGGFIITRWHAEGTKAVTWHFKPLPQLNRCAVCRHEGEEPADTFHEDAVIELTKADGQPNPDVKEYTWQRLTGLGPEAMIGYWKTEKSQEDSQPASSPARVKVTGIPEAVSALTWPPQQP